MRKVRITSVLALAGVTAWAALPGGAVAAATPTGPAAATAVTTPAFAADPQAVTLITGDTVRVSSVDGQTAIDVTPAPGREKIPFITSSAGKNVRVIPADAARLLAEGRLDQRLFDVSTLLSFGYGDTRRTLPLLIQGSAVPDGGQRTKALPGIGVSAYEQDRNAPATLWKSLTNAGNLRSGISKVWLDGLRKPTLDVSVPLIGAPAAWQAGLTGAGVKVAVIDSGVDLTHPDFAGQVADAADFTGTNLVDYNGHGTHVASTILGTGAASSGRYKGVAPGAKLLSAKVCDAEACPESSILAGMTWAAQQGATVANISLGGSDTPEIDPLEAAVNELTAQYGMLFVIAAGNSGPGDVTIDSPGSADAALTVGAVTKTKELIDFSGRGPRIADAAIKPDITAPGVNIVAARASEGVLPPIDDNDAYASISGTSMATPHVAGAVALLAQQHPDWRAGKLKATLTAAADPNAELTPYQQGAGFVDVKRALTQSVTADPVSLGIARLTTTQTKTISYANSGSTAVTLNLALTSDAPAGLFKLNATTVTVPAGKTAAVTLTVQPGAGLADQQFGGQVTATANGVRVVTPIAMDIARHTLTVRTPGLGDEPHEWITLLTDLGRESVTAFAHYGESTAVRVQPGRYVVQSYLLTGDYENPDITSLVDPALVVDADETVTMDRRQAKPVNVTVDDKNAVANDGEVGWTIRTKAPQIWGSNDPYSAMMNVQLAKLSTGRAAGSGKATGFAGYVAGTWGYRDADGTPFNSSSVYHTYFNEQGRMPVGAVKKLSKKDFAKVTTQMGVDVADVMVSRLSVPRTVGNSPVTRSDLNRNTPMSYHYDAVPRTMTEYFYSSGKAQWRTTSAQRGYTFYQGDWKTYENGRSYTDKWATGVNGPVFPQPDFAQQFAARYFGDTMGGPAPLHGDSAGHEGQRSVGEGSVDVWIYRNGKEVAHSTQTPQASEVPAAAGDYRMRALFRSDPAFTLSTVVDAEWTFRSGHVPDGKAVNLPMTAIRFDPAVDINHYAPAGRLFTLPISLDRQVNSAKATTRSLTVEASFDDGKTWKRIPALRLGEKATAVLQHPRGTGFVSLRAAATDSAGNTVRQTIVRAYRYH
ncbi:S8 family serine peptidase [Actinoplanes solisilvae]|uniref:S8 family serine peptidase n=1 Tax=Actinoplanes solisilvae TaxID=2486853 RepID=UPI000FD9DB1F|nr:S8 family serine peptidase [Actinoplanes solisilvae]